MEQRLELAIVDNLDMRTAKVVLDHQDGEKCQDEVPNGKLSVFLFHRRPVLLSRLVIRSQVGEEFFYRFSRTGFLWHFFDLQARHNRNSPDCGATNRYFHE